MTTTTTTTQTPTSTDGIDHQVVSLDPRELAAHPTNVRQSLRDLRGLVRSIKAAGVLVPLVVVPTDDGDGHQIVAGHRRCAAAVEAGLERVPCVVRPDLDDAHQVAAMLVENTQREAISGAEEAAGFEQLAVLGLSDAGIAKATGATRKHVDKARRVAASDTATAVAGRYHLSLDQALVIAELDDDHDAVKDLAATAVKDPARFQHVASRLRQDRERVAQKAATAQALQEAGVRVLSEDKRYNAHPRAAHLSDLVDGEGTPLTPDSHTACPGHCAVVKEWEPTEATYYCLDPTKHGHRSRYSRSGRTTGKMTDEQKAERRQVIENNKAWKAAEPVRRAFVRELLAAKKPPAGVLRYTVTEVLAEPDRVGHGSDELLAEITGIKATLGHGRQVGRRYTAKLNDSRLPLGLLAQVAADNEHVLSIATWRQRSTRAARWLAFLASVGYGLSDIEQHVIDQGQPDAADADDHADADRTGAGDDGAAVTTDEGHAAAAGHGERVAASQGGAEVIVLRSTPDSPTDAVGDGDDDGARAGMSGPEPDAS